jgi:hypothetical protein
MQNGRKQSEYQSIAAQYSAAKAARDEDAPLRDREKMRAAYMAQLAEARFTVTHGLLVAFLTLIL